MALGPWNTPPNFIGAMSAGANAGLTARGQDIASAQAADRLSLAYQQLASEEAARSEAAQQRLQLANQEQLLKSQQINMIDQWHQAQIADEQAKLAKPALHFGTEGEVLREDPASGLISEVRPPRSKPAKFPSVSVPMDPNNPLGPKMTGASNDPEIMSALAKAMAVPPATPKGTGFNLFHPNTWGSVFGTSPAFGDRSTPPVSNAPPIGPGEETGAAPMAGSQFFSGPAPQAAPVAAPATPYKEGALIRNKKNGRLYRVVNGVPVEEGRSPSSDNSQGESTSNDDEEDQ